MTEADPIYRLATELARELAEQRAMVATLKSLAVEAMTDLYDVADELEGQRAVNRQLAERLAKASEVLGRVAEKGRFCAKCARELTNGLS